MLQQDDAEHPVPEALRGAFEQIAGAFAAGDWELKHHAIEGVAPIDPATATFIQDVVQGYGDQLASLDPSTWERSCYGWSGDHWQALVDLTTTREVISDLTLHADIRLNPLLITVRSVHVP